MVIETIQGNEMLDVFMYLPNLRMSLDMILILHKLFLCFIFKDMTS
jgi:hypothetical protein